MYFPPSWIGQEARDHAEMFIADYSSQIFWMSANVHNMLPESDQDYWPDWLELSLGYTARNLCNGGIYPCDPEKSPLVADNVHGRRKIILALDYDMVKLLPDGPDAWNWFKQGLNYIKFPAPAVEFDLEGAEPRFMLVYPFPLW